jgi:hypothetical protein
LGGTRTKERNKREGQRGVGRTLERKEGKRRKRTWDKRKGQRGERDKRTKGKESVRHGPSSLTVRHVGAPWDRPKGGEPQILAIAMAGKVVVDCVGLYVVVIRIGDAAEYSRFSLGDPSL